MDDTVNKRRRNKYENKIKEKENHIMLLHFFDTAVVIGGCLYFSIYGVRISNVSSVP